MQGLPMYSVVERSGHPRLHRRGSQISLSLSFLLCKMEVSGVPREATKAKWENVISSHRHKSLEHRSTYYLLATFYFCGLWKKMCPAILSDTPVSPHSTPALIPTPVEVHPGKGHRGRSAPTHTDQSGLWVLNFPSSLVQRFEALPTAWGLNHILGEGFPRSENPLQ